MPIAPPRVLDYKGMVAAHLTPPGDFPACFAFSIHKAGSSLMNAMIQAVCERAKIPALSIPDRLFHEGIGEVWAEDRHVLELVEEGRVYHGFRYLPPALLEPELCLAQRRSVLLVRDPRDALVSEYFSYGGRFLSHKLPQKGSEEFVERSSATKNMEIDEYVLAVAPDHLKKLKVYRQHLDFERIMLRRYEDIFFDKHRFLREIFEYFQIPVPADILDYVATANDVRPATEDPSKHVRKGTPGDHREKLQPETIQALNNVFRAIGPSFGYDFDA